MIIIVIFLIVGMLSLIKANNLQNITDSNIDDFIEKNKGKTILLIFYVSTCIHSQDALEFIENFETYDKSLINVAEIDCNLNIYSCVRFNIMSVPTIFQLKDNFLYKFTNHITDDSLNAFISNSHSKDNGINFPNQTSQINLYFALFDDAVKIITKFIQQLINDHRKEPFQWEIQYTIVGILGAFSIIFIFSLYPIVKCCFRNKKKLN